MSVRSAGGRLRRTWPQRLLISFNVVCIVAALTSAVMVSYGKRSVDQISRQYEIGAGDITTTEDLPPGAPENFLVVGVDSDAGLDADDPVRGGRDSGAEATAGLRSDTIMVVRVDPGSTRARILSFPRDLWVDIPGHGRSRINAAIQYGRDSGPTLLIQTIKANFDITINHYVQVDFAGFKSLVSQIGGVKVYLDNPVRDGRSGLDQPAAGCVTLDADQALAYARSRHLQYQTEGGRWVGDPTSDLGRIGRQQDFVRRVIRRAIDKGARNPATLARMVNTGTKNLTLDPFTTAQDLIDLGKAFRHYDPDSLVTDTLPVTDAIRGGAAVLDLVDARAEPILAEYRGTGAGDGSDVQPSSVTVAVINGTRKLNQGADTRAALAAVGFQTAALAPDTDVLRTEVRYRPGQESEAMLVARHLVADPILVPVTGAEDITVVTGPDFFSVATAPRPAGEVATTTTSTSTTSTTTSTSTTISTTVPGALPSTTSTTVRDGGGTSAPGGPVGYVPDAAPAGDSCG
ncbi:MAG: transcriptional attenuator, LytR family [Acidimicrobiales bacterium]|nr:transcriptional attenuator, LytR family [Acidimicrobiales bacterium]